jgi:hypothetical protein
MQNICELTVWWVCHLMSLPFDEFAISSFSVWQVWIYLFAIWRVCHFFIYHLMSLTFLNLPFDEFDIWQVLPFNEFPVPCNFRLMHLPVDEFWQVSFVELRFRQVNIRRIDAASQNDVTPFDFYKKLCNQVLFDLKHLFHICRYLIAMNVSTYVKNNVHFSTSFM